MKTLALAILVALPGPARAGGFDVPDIGTEALGRGGAFAAKADNGTALYYNVAGLAQQRGTRVMFDINLVFNDIAFTRDGVYAGDPKDPRTPWAGQRFPTVHNSAPFGYQPFLAVTTDAGIFERLTLGLAVYAPPGIGQRQYGYRRDVTVVDKNGVASQTPRFEVDLPTRDDGSSWQAPGGPLRAPAPSRYDVAFTNFAILMPTLGAGYHLHKMLDVGLAVSWVVAQFDLMNAAIPNLGPSTCIGSPEYPHCDSYGEIHTTAHTVGFLFSGLAHPLPWLDAGLSIRPQVNVNSEGIIHPFPAIASPTKIDDFPATFAIKLPTTVRAGVRTVSRYLDGSERADLELDVVYENWSVEDFAHIHSDNFPMGKPGPDGNGTLSVDVPHHYKDTVSVRLGGAYQHPLSERSRLILRVGGYYESPTTDVNDTHLDAFTFEKLAFTVGVGVKVGGFTFNLAYAGLWMPTRVVDNSSVQAASATNGTQWPRDTMGRCIDPCPVVGNGRYEPSIHMLSFGLAFHFDEFR